MDSGWKNRARTLCENWQDKEMMLEELSGKRDNSIWAKQEYDFLCKGISRISPDATPDEKFILELVKKTVNDLEIKIYPNRFLRALVKLKRILYDAPLRSSAHKKLKTENLESISSELKKFGINPEKSILDHFLNYEQQHVNVNVTTPFASNDFDIQLNFSKNESGGYDFKSYLGTLNNSRHPEQSRTFLFDSKLEINSREAVNMLEGRPVLKYYPQEDRTLNSKWMQLDFSKTASDGLPKLIQTDANYEFRLKDKVSEIAARLNQPELNAVKVLKGLEQGNPIALIPTDGPSLYLVLDSLKKEIKILDNEFRPVKQVDLLSRHQKGAELNQQKVRSVGRKIERPKKLKGEQSLDI